MKTQTIPHARFIETAAASPRNRRDLETVGAAETGSTVHEAAE